MTTNNPDRPSLPVGAVTADRLCGSAFNTGAEPREVTWTGEPVARPPRRWGGGPGR